MTPRAASTALWGNGPRHDTRRIATEVEIDCDYREKKDGHTASDHASMFADLD